FLPRQFFQGPLQIVLLRPLLLAGLVVISLLGRIWRVFRLALGRLLLVSWPFLARIRPLGRILRIGVVAVRGRGRKVFHLVGVVRVVGAIELFLLLLFFLFQLLFHRLGAGGFTDANFDARRICPIRRRVFVVLHFNPELNCLAGAEPHWFQPEVVISTE